MLERQGPYDNTRHRTHLHNEKENLEPLVTRLIALPVSLGVIIVDDGSLDGTGEIADRLAAENPGRVQVIHRAGKLGLGTAYIAGFHRAMEDRADFAITMDADFSHPLEKILGAARQGRPGL